MPAPMRDRQEGVTPPVRATTSGYHRAMADIIDSLSDQQVTDLMALADGSLAPGRRAAVESWVAGSSDLEELVRRQRLSLAATGPLAEAPVPESLRRAAEAAAPARRPARHRRRWTIVGAATALAAVVAVFVVLSLGQSPVGPTVADAAQLTTLPATSAAPSAVAGSGRLTASEQGLAFPDFSGSYGWRPVGLRHDTIAGRDATVVYYANGGRQVGYAIVASPVLAPPKDAVTTTRGGVEYQSFTYLGRSVVTWRRDGHTCVMVGAVPPATLLDLASWSGAGA
jgi:hypothetical protein